MLSALFDNVRELFHLSSPNGKNTSRFSILLARYCPLPSSYNDLKYRTRKFLVKREDRAEDGTSLFNDLYSAASSYKEVILLLKECLRRIVPVQLLGLNNKHILMEMMG